MLAGRKDASGGICCWRFDYCRTSEFMPEYLEIPWPRRRRLKIAPVFLPFLGCPGRCVFCNQEEQTGQAAAASPEQVREMLAEREAALRGMDGRKLAQLAFYGGTFTAMPDNIWNMCLEFAIAMRKQGLIADFRCSTRPDRLAPQRLLDLKNAGCALVELGIQSFNDAALAASGRGYGAAQASAACAALRTAGLGPGIQLMPGLPGATPQDFLRDARMALEEGAACLRFYPLLVLAGSPLAKMWAKRQYQPLALETTLNILADAWLMAAERNVPVIRMGVAPQAGLDTAILAGPAHPALGSRVMGLALCHAVARRAAGRQFRLRLPAAMQGCWRGWRGELNVAWRQLRLLDVGFWQADVVRLEFA